MSHWDSDADHRDWREGPYRRPNATCTDCGAPFVLAREDFGGLCDACCDARDDHTTALETRMAKASLRAAGGKAVA